MAQLRSKLVHVRVIFLTSIRNGTSRFTPFLTGHPITVLISIVNHHRDQNFSRYDYFFFFWKQENPPSTELTHGKVEKIK